MSQRILATRYARALAQVVPEDQDLDAHLDQLEAFADAFNTNADLNNALTNPSIPKPQRAAVLNAVMADDNSPVAKLLQELFRRGRLTLVNHVAARFRSQANQRAGRTPGTLTCSKEPSETQLESIRVAVSAYTGKDVHLKTRIDPDMLGGVVVRMGDVVIDGSLRTRLAKLRHALLEEENGSNENSSH